MINEIYGKCALCGGPLTTWHYFLKHSKKEDNYRPSLPFPKEDKKDSK